MESPRGHHDRAQHEIGAEKRRRAAVHLHLPVGIVGVIDQKKPGLICLQMNLDFPGVVGLDEELRGGTHEMSFKSKLAGRLRQKHRLPWVPFRIAPFAPVARSLT